MKHFLTLIFAAMLAGQAWAQTTFTKDNLEYTVTDETNHYVSVGKAETKPTGDLEIKGTVSYEGVVYTVTSIASSGFYGCNKLTSITLPSTITNIGFESFYNCNQLTAFIIPSAMTSIGKYAFRACSSLTSITIPSGVSSIGDFAFESCSGLTAINVESGNATYCSIDGVLFKKKNTYLSLICYPSSKADTEYNLPDNVSSIETKAFYGCKYLASINVSNSNHDYYSDNGVLLDINKRTLIVYPSQKTDATYSIPNTVEIILYKAFYQCQNLKSLIIPKSVTDIDDYGIHNCTNLTINCCAASKPSGWLENWSYNVADVVWDYDPSAKKWTVTLLVNNSAYGSVSGGGIVKDGTNVTITATPVEGCRFVDWSNGLITATATITVTSDTAIVANFEKTYFKYEITSSTTAELIWSDKDLVDAKIPETVEIDGKTYTVTSIGNDAFYYRYDMTSITIPNTVTHIGKEAFGYCSGLTSITIPNSVTSMDKAVFKGCSSLESITLPYAFKQPLGYIFGESEYEGAIKTVQEQLLERTPNTISHEWFEFYIPSTLKSVTINGGKLANSAFYNCNGLSTIIIGYSVTTISEEAFYGCGGLTTVVIGNFEGGEDVYGNNSLATVIIGDGVKSVGGYAFRGCNNLKTVIIGDSVTDIGDGAFNNCDRLTSVVIGESVESIGENAFYGCGSLKSVVIGKSVDSVGDYAFNGCDSLSSVIIKSDVNLSISELWIKKDGVQYRVENKNTVSVDHDYEYDYSGDIVIPATVTAGTIFDVKSIAPYAFNYDSITSITIPNSVTEIGEAAFSHCRCLTTITIPNSVVSIGGWAFNTCTSLTEINVESGNTEYVSVDGVLFNKDKTILISYPAGKTGEYIIPSSVKEIATHAFSGCNDSTTIIIPKTVRTIDYYAFYDCAATIKCMVNEKPDGWDSGWRDNFKGVVVWAAIIESAANTVNIYAHGSTIVVENATDEIRVYNAMGALVGRDAAHCVHAEIIVNGEGVYIIKTGSTVKRVVIN